MFQSIYLITLSILIIAPFANAVSHTRKSPPTTGLPPSFLSYSGVSKKSRPFIISRMPSQRPESIYELLAEVFHSDQTVVYDSISPTPSITFNIYIISRHETLDSVLEEARFYHINKALFSEAEWSEEYKETVSDQNWDYLSDYDDMVQGLPLEKPDRIFPFNKWLKAAITLRDKNSGRYTHKQQAYIDLCLQYMTLRHTRWILPDKAWFFQEFENNPLAKLQAYMCKYPDKHFHQLKTELYFFRHERRFKEHVQEVAKKFGRKKLKKRLKTAFSGFNNLRIKKLMPKQGAPEAAVP